MNMFESARSEFSLEPGVVYLDSASTGLLPRVAEDAARLGVASKGRPWTRDRQQAHAQADVLRALAASFIGADAADMAITCAVSYGLAVARKNLPLRPGERVLVLEDDHTSQLLTWEAHALDNAGVLEKVKRPANSDWTSAILEHLHNTRYAPPAIASLGATFWRDGSHVDLKTVCDALYSQGTRIVLDLTQSVGVLDLDVRALHADFAVFPMYKWLLGPYSLAFLYVASQWQQGHPLEENSFNRAKNSSYGPGAQRFDMGERDAFVGMPAAVASLKLLANWNRADIEAWLVGLTQGLASRMREAGIDCVPEAMRSPHILGIRDVPPGTVESCRQQLVFVTQRGSELRVSPHVFNTVADMDRCADAVIAHFRGN